MPTSGSRDQHRKQLLAEIHELGLRQLDEGGVGALSVAGIAKQLGMDPSSLFYYFASKEDLLFSIVLAAANELSDVQQTTAARTHDATPAERLRAIMDDGRRWCLDNPSRFRLLFSSGVGMDDARSSQLVEASFRGLRCVMDAVASFDIAPQRHESGQTVSGPDENRAALDAVWPRRPAALSGFPRDALLRSYRVAVYLMGIFTVDVGGHFQAHGLDKDRFWTLELDRILADLQAGRGPSLA